MYTKNNRFDVCLSSLDLHSVSMDFIKVNNQSCFVSPIIPSKRSDFFQIYIMEVVWYRQSADMQLFLIKVSKLK